MPAMPVPMMASEGIQINMPAARVGGTPRMPGGGRVGPAADGLDGRSEAPGSWQAGFAQISRRS